MTVEQLESAKELDTKIKRIKGVIVDLEDVVHDLKVYRGYKYTPIRIEVGCGYKQTPPINLMSLISFLEEQKTKYKQEVDRLNKEFTEL